MCFWTATKRFKIVDRFAKFETFYGNRLTVKSRWEDAGDRAGYDIEIDAISVSPFTFYTKFSNRNSVDAWGTVHYRTCETSDICLWFCTSLKTEFIYIFNLTCLCLNVHARRSRIPCYFIITKVAYFSFILCVHFKFEFLKQSIQVVHVYSSPINIAIPPGQ